MAYAKHIIKKQVIELQMAGSLDRTSIQNRVSRIYRQEIVPLLDKLLSEKSASSALIIDRLEINIGRIPESKLEKVLSEKISKALQESLDNIKTQPAPEVFAIIQPAATLKESHSDTEAVIQPAVAPQESDSGAELVFYFLQTGVFPWWAQETTYTWLEQAFRSVLHKNNKSIRSRFRLLVQDTEIVKRIVYTFNDTLLTQTAAWLIQNNIAAIHPRKEQLFRFFTGRISDRQLQEYWWCSIYEAITATNIRSAEELAEKAGSLFVHLAAHTSNDAALLQYLQENRTTTGILEKITSFTNHSPTSESTTLLKEIREQKKAPDNTGNELSRSMDVAKNSSLQTKNIGRESSPGSPFKTEKTDPDQFSEKAAPKHKVSNSENKKQDQLKDNKKPAVINNLQPFIKPFTGTDKIYIQNAGLVLLWPFLQRFFQNMDLADDKTFTDEYGAERACLLLQYLVTGSTEDLFEAQLPLNKILCGTPLLQPVNTQWAISDDEKEIAENFLLAVIQNGGAGWKNLSVDGLRQAYLNREGIISSRDGNWLLQVKRETYDILVDRLPWTIQAVKLPWMDRLVFVEW